MLNTYKVLILKSPLSVKVSLHVLDALCVCKVKTKRIISTISYNRLEKMVQCIFTFEYYYS